MTDRCRHYAYHGDRYGCAILGECKPIQAGPDVSACPSFLSHRAPKTATAGVAQPPVDCVHLGEPTGETVTCPTCNGGAKQADVYACDVRDRCAPSLQVHHEVTGCGKCRDRTPVNTLHVPIAAPPIDVQPDPIRPTRIVKIDLPGAFNPGLIEWRGKLLATARQGSGILLLELDPETYAAKWTRKLDLTHKEYARGEEDARLFVHAGKLHLAFTAYHRADGPSSQMFARLRDNFTVEAIWCPDYPHRAAWEKNWATFEHDGTLYSIYAIAPHHVILRHENYAAERLHVTRCPINFERHKLRGGASPVRVGDEYYHWCHTHRVINGKKVYGLGLYTFESREPFAVKRFIPALVMSANGNAYAQSPWATSATAEGHRVIFPVGALKRGGEWIVSAGVRDAESWLIHFDADEVEAKLDHGKPMTEPVRLPLVHAPSTVASDRIAVGTLYTPDIADYGGLSADALRSYAARHGYRYLVSRETLDPSRPASWSKIALAERAFDDGCEWFFWLDADAIITEPSRRLQEFIDDELDFIAGSDPPCSWFNMGVWFLRNCDAAREFLRRTWAKDRYVNHRWWEQLAAQTAITEGVPGLRYRIVPRAQFQSFGREHRPGDFVLHCTGWDSTEQNQAMRRKLIREQMYRAYWPAHWRRIDIADWFNYESVYDAAVEDAAAGAVFVEVGCWMGRSAAYMAQRVKDRGVKVLFYCVDPWQWTGDRKHPRAKTCYDATYAPKPMRQIFDENIAACGLTDFVMPLQMPSVEAATRFADASADFVFIDGDHSYESVTADIAAWRPKIKSGGVLAGHDLGLPDVERAVREAFGDAFAKAPGNSWMVKL